MLEVEGNREETEGVFNNWAIIGLMAFGFIFKSLLGRLDLQNPDVLLNNFSKSYPNLSLIAKRSQGAYFIFQQK